MRIDPVPRSIKRMQPMVEPELRYSEKLVAAIPMWIGGTYVPFLGSILGGVAIASVVGAALGEGAFLLLAAGGAIGAWAGRRLAKLRSADHPIRARSLQVFVGITDRRVLIHEPKGFGQKARLVAAFPVGDVGNVTFHKGGVFRPGRLSFGVAGVEQRYEFSGLWDVGTVLDALA